MSAKYLGLQPVAYGVLDGTASPAAFVGETVGFGAVTDTGTGDWTIAVDADVGLPAAISSGCTAILASPIGTAGRAATVSITSATAIRVLGFDLATPTATDVIVMLVIFRWPG